MTGAVLTLILIAALFAAVAAVRFFRTLDAIFWRDAATPIVAGLVAGAFFYLTDHPVAIGIVLTLAALYVRLTGRESEPDDGMLMGALTGAAAALPLALGDRIRYTECVLAGAIAGYGVTYAAFYVSRRGKQVAIDSITAAAAILGALLPRVIALPERDIEIATTVLIPLLGIVAMLKKWRDVTHELMDEANHGIIDVDDVRVVSHPFRRLGAAGWADPRARREFVRVANTIALRKRQQRSRPEDEVRLYQVEIIKLRMQLQEMKRIDQEVRANSMAAS